MKNLIILILIFCFGIGNAFAGCDWKTGITPGPNHTFIYSQECHEAVGQLVQANKDLASAITLKDLAVKDDDSRVALWEQTADNEQSKLSTIESYQSKSNWMMFALGVGTVVLSGFMTARLIGR